jgi:hypothetical protein
MNPPSPSPWIEIAASRRRLEDRIRKDCRWAELTGKDPEEVLIALHLLIDDWMREIQNL